MESSFHCLTLHPSGRPINCFLTNAGKHLAPDFASQALHASPLAYVARENEIPEAGFSGHMSHDACMHAVRHMKDAPKLLAAVP